MFNVTRQDLPEVLMVNDGLRGFEHRYLDKLIDELAKGKAMEKILRP